MQNKPIFHYLRTRWVLKINWRTRTFTNKLHFHMKNFQYFFFFEKEAAIFRLLSIKTSILTAAAAEWVRMKNWWLNLINFMNLIWACLFNENLSKPKMMGEIFCCNPLIIMEAIFIVNIAKSYEGILGKYKTIMKFLWVVPFQCKTLKKKYFKFYQS